MNTLYNFPSSDIPKNIKSKFLLRTYKLTYVTASLRQSIGLLWVVHLAHLALRFHLQWAYISGRYIYGGYYDGSVGTSVPDSDFYILSLPAFRWFRANSPSPELRSFHTCNSAGNTQMIIVGGYDRTHYYHPRNSPPDSWSQQINVYDMSALQWKDRYDSQAGPYTPPDMILQIYNSPYVSNLPQSLCFLH